jgi:hypothetical protein
MNLVIGFFITVIERKYCLYIIELSEELVHQRQKALALGYGYFQKNHWV